MNNFTTSWLNLAILIVIYLVLVQIQRTKRRAPLRYLKTTNTALHLVGMDCDYIVLVGPSSDLNGVTSGT